MAISVIPYLGFNGNCKEAVESFSEGGTILNPLLPHPKPDDSGMGAVVKDKYGYQWIFTCPNPDYRGE